LAASARASVTFGDAAGAVTTGTMPILFYFKVTANNPSQCDDTGTIQNASSTQQGWFGVNTRADGVVVGGRLATSQTPPSCRAHFDAVGMS
jgi:hypothetical protein